MKKVYTKINFIDSSNPSFISRKIHDSCKRIIDEYNQNPTIVSPVLKVGSFPNGDWDTGFSEGMTNFKRINLNEHVNEEGVLSFDKIISEISKFIETAKTNTVKNKISEVTVADDEDRYYTEEGILVGGLTYKEYLIEERIRLGKSDFRYILIGLLLGEGSNWGYIRKPDSIEGDSFDIITPDNIKELIKKHKKEKER